MLPRRHAASTNPARIKADLLKEEILQSVIAQICAPVERCSARGIIARTSYLSAGVGKPVVLIHGGDAGAGSLRWFPVIGPLSANFHVIAPDVAGYGESDKPWAAYDGAFFSAWLKDFLETLGLERVSLVGHSVGGAIALQFTLDHPQFVERLALVNAAGLGKGMLRVPAGIKFRMIWQNLFPSYAAGRRFLVNHGLYDPDTLDQTMAAVEDYGCEVIRSPGGRRVFWLGRGKVITPISTERLRRIVPPVLLVWGEEDPNFPVSIARQTAREMPNAQLDVIPRASHNCFCDQPTRFDRALINFLSA